MHLPAAIREKLADIIDVFIEQAGSFGDTGSTVVPRLKPLRDKIRAGKGLSDREMGFLQRYVVDDIMAVIWMSEE